MRGSLKAILLLAMSVMAASHMQPTVQQIDSSHIMYDGRVYQLLSPASQRRLLQHNSDPAEPPAETTEQPGNHEEEPAAGAHHEKAEEEECEVEHQLLPKDGAKFWGVVALTLLCTCSAATAAGLTLGLLSIDKLNLEILSNDDPNRGGCDWSDPHCSQRANCSQAEAEKAELEQKYAKQIFPVIEPHSEANAGSCWQSEPHHLLMVTLLLMNAIANEALPIFLDKLMPNPIVAVLVSVSVVLIVGEIIPTALFTGEHQLRLAAMMVPVVYFCKTIFAPIAWPIAWILDNTLGNHGNMRFNRGELRTLIAIHGQTAMHRSMSDGSDDEIVDQDDIEALNNALVDDEVDMVKGVLQLRDQHASQHMTPIKDVKMVSIKAVLDEELMAELISCGHSRVPVYSEHKSNVKGVLLMKRLIAVNPDDRRPVETMQDVWKEPIFISGDINLQDLLNVFQKTKQHIALVSKDIAHSTENKKKYKHHDDIDEGEVLGIITLEDVLEYLIQEEIYDETDNTDSVRVKLAEAFTLQRRLPALRKLVKLERNKGRIQDAAVSHLRARGTPRSFMGTVGDSTDEPHSPVGHSVIASEEDGYVSVQMN